MSEKRAVSYTGGVVGIAAMAGTIMGFFVGVVFGVHLVRDEPTLVSEPSLNERESECHCGHTRTCAFGPGIVGQQTCRTGPFMINEWTRCEPAPADN